MLRNSFGNIRLYTGLIHTLLTLVLAKIPTAKKKDVLTIGISEIESELELWDRTITDMQVPTGMGVYDTAAFADEYSNQKTTIRLRVKALQTVKQQIKTRCLDYAIRIECELKAKNKSQSFLAQIHTDVNNYLKSHSEDVYTKLNKAAELVDSNDLEDCSLLLTQVRRAIKASADFLYPPKKEMVKCKDGIKRDLGNDQYLNRLQEYIAITFDNSSSRDLLRSELEYLANFARRLNDVASKGVHADVNPVEAKQGLLGLYMFLYNVTSRLQCHSSQSKAAVTQSG